MAKKEEEFNMFKLGFDGLIDWALKSTEDYRRKESQKDGKQ